MKMLSAGKVVTAFGEIVERAERTIVIVTPYFDPWTHLAQALYQKLDRKVTVDLLLRGGEDQAKSAVTAAPFAQRGARVQYLDRLHAKVYLSEQQALLTSMNLIKSSRDSWEVGTLFDATEDAASYQEIAALAGGLFQTINLPATSERTRSRATPEATAAPAPARPRPTRSQRSAGGHCIRCAAPVKANPDKPLCRDCFALWAEYENEDYAEHFCHLCGRESGTSVAKPLCRPCWDKTA